MKEVDQIALSIGSTIEQPLRYCSRMLEKLDINHFVKDNHPNWEFFGTTGYQKKKGNVENEVTILNDFCKEAVFLEVKGDHKKLIDSVLQYLKMQVSKVRESDLYCKRHIFVYPDKRNLFNNLNPSFTGIVVNRQEN